MGWKKGQSGNPLGKPKGAKNKFTKMKESFASVFKQVGGTKALRTWVEADPENKKAFYEMIVRLMPKDSNVSIEGTITTSDRAVRAAESFFERALGERPGSGDGSESPTLPH